ncbi:MAG: HypC/HybG/HupF family hydrogenase formation chaperone [candidate division WOR-3 bacterium]|jgi:hydrogenase expression/formation protein HypC|nr:HypC/HybG/HupF family hydrogenase formation chaperone [candidate division WOR-3 bacterium]MDH7518242.1 HypC/HybG/HupF family hydrogenase formation chaperone [bacterium]
MCLAIPTRIVAIEGERAIGEVGGVQREISIVMTPGVKVGDYVIVHAGFAIQVLNKTAAEETREIFEQMAQRVSELQNKAQRRR